MIFLNGRFLQQSLTGVQRFSIEMMTAIDRLAGEGQWPETVVLLPRGTDSCNGESVAGRYRHLQFCEVGRTQGHIWEQTELPTAARGGILVNLGNTAPVLTASRQIVVIHDAGVFDTPESYSLRFRAWYKTMQFGLARTGAQIATVSEYSRDRIVTRLGLDPAHVPIIYEGAEHILRDPADQGILDRHGLRPRRFAVVVSSRAAHKNLAVLADAAAMLARRGMVIAVAGGGNPEVLRALHTAGAAELCIGRVTDAELRALYENAICLLFPSQYEGFGLPPVEAMACGCPVLTSRGGAVEEICGDDALYFASDDPAAVINAIERLLDEDGLSNDLRVRGRRRSARLSWDGSARALGHAIHVMAA
jgi:glycosyltransferase involved in cell wall biosynthesis